MAALHCLPIRFHVDFKVLMFTYKALNGLRPQYLAKRLLPPRSTRITHVSQEVRLRSLTPTEGRKEKTWKRAFSAVAPHLWNNLPPAICAAPILGIFKTQLNTWLYIQAFPPVNTWSLFLFSLILLSLQFIIIVMIVWLCTFLGFIVWFYIVSWLTQLISSDKPCLLYTSPSPRD